MLPVERRRRILETIGREPAATVIELARELAVSRETIRHDLRVLASEGLILRSHGGAVRVDREETDRAFLARERENPGEKRAIARAAAAYIDPGDVLMLDASTTVLVLASLLPRNYHLTVLTNSAVIPAVLVERDDVTVISTGGILRPLSRSYYGQHAEGFLSRVHAHKAFLSCQGVHPVLGVSESNLCDAQVKACMVKQAGSLYVLADHSKLGRVSLAEIAPIAKVTRLITDEGAGKDMISELTGAGLQIDVSPR